MNQSRDLPRRTNASFKSFLLGLLILFCLTPSVWSLPAKNVILFVGDGMGYNAVDAADFYTGKLSPYRRFPVQYGMTTYSAGNNAETNPKGYDPAKAWTSFDYLRSNATDSASAATALYAGVKVYDGRISWSTDNQPLITIAQIASQLGKSTGAVSSVPLSHATPAAVAAHNVSRGNYAEIANEMIFKSDLTVIMGPGHPEYSNDGVKNDHGDYQFVGGKETWAKLTGEQGANGFTLIQTKEEFENLAAGKMKLPKKLIGVPQVHSTLQFHRSQEKVDAQQVAPETYNTNIPTLATMTKGALRVLGQNPEGFFVMIEGGAIDWAGHSNWKGRLIEEQIDFNDSVQAAIDWVNANSNWEETLLIVTSDHETGYLWGAKGYFTPITFKGVGQVPEMVFNSGGHTNSLVPLYAIGAGADFFEDHAVGVDPVRGQYVDNTDVFHVMDRAMKEQPAEEEASEIVVPNFCSPG